MTYHSNGLRVMLEMSQEEWTNLLIMLGMATGMAFNKSNQEGYRWVKLVNAMNETNPQFRPYEIPEAFK